MSVLVEEWKVSFSKDVGLQLGTLLNITLCRRCFSGFAMRLVVPNRETHQIHQIFGWKKIKMFHNNLHVFIIYQLSYICFTWNHYINHWFMYHLYIYCRVNVVTAGEGKKVLQNMQWEILNLFNTLTLKQFFWKTKTLFKKL